MFKINYIIVDEYMEDILEFVNSDDADVIGQIELCFNDKKVSFMDEKVRFLDLSLLQWMKALNKILFLLQEHSTVNFWIPESNGIWIVFERKHRELKVSKIRSSTVVKRNDCISIENLSYDKIEWEEMILTNQFYEQVTNKIKVLNGKLASSHHFDILLK